MENKKEIQDELIKISQPLSEIKKENNFSIPADYFKTLSDEIQQKTFVPKNKIVLGFENLFENLFLRYAVSILAIGVVVFFAIHNFTINKYEHDLFTNAETYILDQADASILIDYINETQQNTDLKSKDFIDDNILDIIDEELLIEQL